MNSEKAVSLLPRGIIKVMPNLRKTLIKIADEQGYYRVEKPTTVR